MEEENKELMDKIESEVREKVANMGADEEISAASDDDFEIKDFDEEV